MELDREWYENTYDDVKKSGLGGEHHFIKYGQVEGRFPSPKYIPSELLKNGSIERQINDLKVKINDEDLNNYVNQDLFNASRFQLLPKTLLLNQVYSICEKMMVEVKNQRKKRIVIYDGKSLISRIIKKLDFTHKNLYIKIIGDEINIQEVIIENGKSLVKIQLEYPFCNTDNFMYQIFNYILFWKYNQAGRSATKISCFAKNNKPLFKKFIKIYGMR